MAFIVFQGFNVGWMRGTLICDNSPLCGDVRICNLVPSASTSSTPTRNIWNENRTLPFMPCHFYFAILVEVKRFDVFVEVMRICGNMSLRAQASRLASWALFILQFWTGSRGLMCMYGSDALVFGLKGCLICGIMALMWMSRYVSLQAWVLGNRPTLLETCPM